MQNIWATFVTKFATKKFNKITQSGHLVVAQLAERSLRYQRSAVRIQSLEIFIQIIFVDF